jgi:hypothetical protein
MTKKNEDDVASGLALTVGSWYRITQIDKTDPNPSLKVGDVIECQLEKPGCIDPENRLGEGMGVEWYADFDGEEAYRTLVTGVQFVSTEKPRTVTVHQ